MNEGEGRIRIEAQGPRWDLVLDRPRRRNAFGGTMREDLATALQEAASRWPEVRVVVLRGEGGAFCAGGDVENLQRLRESSDLEGLRSLLSRGAAVIRAVRAFPGPVVAVADGPAMGAGLALYCSAAVRIASTKASFGMAFVRIGLHPDWGAAALVTEAVGPSRARELAVTGRVVGADEAYRMGLCHHLAAPEDLGSVVDPIVRSLCDAAPLAQAAIQRTFMDSALEQAFERESAAQAELFGTADLDEGLRAFLEKRPARYEGR